MSGEKRMSERQNWAQKYEQQQDKLYEQQLKDILDELARKMERLTGAKKIQCLQEIIEKYKELRRLSSEYFDEEDYELKKEQLNDCWKAMERSHDESRDSFSWNELREEEEVIDERE